MANLNGYLKSSEVIGDVAVAIHDSGMAIVKPPHYMRLFQKALAELALDVPFDQRHVHIPVPDNKKVPLPKYMSGLRNLYLFNGENCDIHQSVRVLIKENFAHNGGSGYFANTKWCNFNDWTQASLGWLAPLNMWVAGISEGCIDLGDTCGYDLLRIEYTGLGFDEYCQGEELYAPVWARQALVDKVAMWALEVRMAYEGRERLYMELYKMRKADCDSSAGSWMTARMRFSMLDQKDMQDTVFRMTGIERGI